MQNDKVYSRPGDRQTVYLKEVVRNSRIASANTQITTILPLIPSISAQ